MQMMTMLTSRSLTLGRVTSITFPFLFLTSFSACLEVGCLTHDLSPTHRVPNQQACHDLADSLWDKPDAQVQLIWSSEETKESGKYYIPLPWVFREGTCAAKVSAVGHPGNDDMTFSHLAQTIFDTAEDCLQQERAGKYGSWSKAGTARRLLIEVYGVQAAVEVGSRDDTLESATAVESPVTPVADDNTISGDILGSLK